MLCDSLCAYALSEGNFMFKKLGSQYLKISSSLETFKSGEME